MQDPENTIHGGGYPTKNYHPVIWNRCQSNITRPDVRLCRRREGRSSIHDKCYWLWASIFCTCSWSQHLPVVLMLTAWSKTHVQWTENSQQDHSHLVQSWEYRQLCDQFRRKERFASSYWSTFTSTWATNYLCSAQKLILHCHIAYHWAHKSRNYTKSKSTYGSCRRAWSGNTRGCRVRSNHAGVECPTSWYGQSSGQRKKVSACCLRSRSDLCPSPIPETQTLLKPYAHPLWVRHSLRCM